jgi:hypothetical protein
MPDRTRFFIWRQNGNAIAFSVALVHNGVLYDDYLGLDYEGRSRSPSLLLYSARHH